jgi:FkbM family methyltransferase
MSMWRTARTFYSDAARGGFGFAVGGLREKLGRTDTIAISLKDGRRVHVRPGDSDFATLRQVFRESSYELETQPVRDRIDARYRALLAEKVIPVIVDAGANIGAATLWFRARYPAATVVAIEPDPANAAMLRRNVEADPGVIACEAAIGSRPGHVSITREHRASWGAQTTRDEAGCPIVTVAEACGKVPGGRLFIVKVDIEGFESDLFADGTDWIDDAFVIYVEPHDWMLPGKGTSRAFQAEFGRRDYELHLRGENLVYVRPDLAG